MMIACFGQFWIVGEVGPLSAVVLVADLGIFGIVRQVGVVVETKQNYFFSQIWIEKNATSAILISEG